MSGSGSADAFLAAAGAGAVSFVLMLAFGANHVSTRLAAIARLVYGTIRLFFITQFIFLLIRPLAYL